jgi:hypothetical protein
MDSDIRKLPIIGGCRCAATILSVIEALAPCLLGARRAYF